MTDKEPIKLEIQNVSEGASFALMIAKPAVAKGKSVNSTAP